MALRRRRLEALGGTRAPRSSWRISVARVVLLSLGLAMLGCSPPEPGEGLKIGRYVFRESPAGFEVYEVRGFLARWIERVLGRTPRPKIRVGSLRGGPEEIPVESIARVVVGRRRLLGPEAKPTAAKRPFEVRLRGPADEELPPFFYFRFEKEAEDFAEEMRRRLARTSTPSR